MSYLSPCLNFHENEFFAGARFALAVVLCCGAVDNGAVAPLVLANNFACHYASVWCVRLVIN